VSVGMYTVQSPCNDNWHINAQTCKPVHVGNCVKHQTTARRSDASCNMKLLEGCVVGLNGTQDQNSMLLLCVPAAVDHTRLWSGVH